MRTTALPSILEILAKNYNNRNEKAYLYELAREYIPTTDDKLPVEKNKLIGGFYGLSDFFELKGIVEETLDRLSIYDYDVEASADEFAYHPGRCAVLTIDGERIGVFGELHPQVAENYGIVERVYAFELEADLLFKYTKSEKQYTPLPKFPAVTRDIAVICDENIPVLTLEKAMKNLLVLLSNLLSSLMYIKVNRLKRVRRMLHSESQCVLIMKPSQMNTLTAL